MGKHQKSPSSASFSSDDRVQWKRIFGTLVKILRSQQSEVETLAEDRKFYEKYVHIQHEIFSWRVQFLECHIAQLKKEEEKGRKLCQSKLDLMVALKEEEVLRYKKQCELADTDLEDFRACVEALSAELSELKAKQKSKEAGKDNSSVDNSKQAERCTTVLEEEIRMLKHSCKKLNLQQKAYEKLSSEKEVEVSALLAEKDFVWNQLKVMESDYNGKLMEKKIEVEHCNEAIEKLQHNLMELQESVNEKDNIIAELKARHELDMRRHTQEAQQANEKIEQLQLAKEELGSLVKEKDETINRLKSELAKLEMDVLNCNIKKSRLFKKHSDDDPMLRLESNPRKGSRKCKSESSKHGTRKNCRDDSDDSSRELSRLVPLIIFHLKKKYLCKTEAEVKEASAPGDLGFATRVPNDMLVVTISLCYSVIAPIIIPFGVLYFGLGWLIARNQALKVYIPSYESYGRMWPHMHARIIAALVIYQVTMLGYIGLKEFYYAPLVLPLIMMSFIFAYVCKKRFYRAFAYTPLEVACQDSKENPNLESVYTAYIPDSLKPEKIDDVESFEDARSETSKY